MFILHFRAALAAGRMRDGVIVFFLLRGASEERLVPGLPAVKRLLHIVPSPGIDEPDKLSSCGVPARGGQR
jgi:hypothetical protein